MESRYLYRGKRIDNGEWVEGYLSYPSCTEKGNESYYFYAKDSLGFFCRCVVDASTICQCTGLKDKNGKLIWENDMVKGAYFVNGKEHRFIGKVGYVGSAFKVVGVKQYSGMRQELHSVYAIIGNIFDNPELLA
nr:MAG TPA: YopX protein [Caudoviricetes sp.]